MAAQWVVHLTTRTGLEGGLIDVYRQELASRASGDEVALLVPTQQAAETVRRLALEVGSGVPALLDARLMTFPQLAETVLVANHHGSRQIAPLQRELLVGEVLAGLAGERKLGYLQATFAKPGTVKAVGALLDEIKRGGISSEEFPALIERGAAGHSASRVVAAIFSRYQERLQALDLYDEPGLFWNALEVLQQGARKPLEALKVLLVDGFQEFTTTQMEMLKTLGETAERIEVRLWLEERRPAMTPRSGATLERLRKTVAPEVRPDAVRAPAVSSNLGLLRQGIFSNDECGISGLDGTVQLLEVAGGMVGECRELARRLKLALSEPGGPQPNQVAIFLRSWDTG
ncbi:MAG: UvrD-helicase domain-containing protein, partial [Armatimonadota bacterium]